MGNLKFRLLIASVIFFVLVTILKQDAVGVLNGYFMVIIERSLIFVILAISLITAVFYFHPTSVHVSSVFRTVPIVHRGTVTRDALAELIGPSLFDSQFENPATKRVDNLMEGLYVRTEAADVVTGRAKFVRPEFVEKVQQSEHWQHQAMVPNRLADGVDIWS